MRRAILLLAFAALAGCGKSNAPGEVPCGSPDGCSTVIARYATGESVASLISDGAGGAYAALLGSRDLPACNAGSVCHGQLLRIDADGTEEWRQGERKSVDHPFAIYEGVAYRRGDGALVARWSTGVERWTAQIDDPALAASEVDGAIYVAGGGFLRRLDTLSGAELWKVPFAVTLPIDPVPVRDVYDRTVLAGGYESTGVLRYTAFDSANGAERWSVSLPAQYSAPQVVLPGLPGPVLLVADRLALTSWEGGAIWTLDGAEGFRNARRATGGGWFVLGPLLSLVTRLRADGSIMWSGPLPAPVVWLSPTPDGQLLLGQQDGVVRKVNRDTGAALWVYGGVSSVKAPAPPLYDSKGDAVFFGANVGTGSDTNLRTVSPAGADLDHWDAGARIAAIAIGKDDEVFVAVTDGTLYVRRAAGL